MSMSEFIGCIFVAFAGGFLFCILLIERNYQPPHSDRIKALEKECEALRITLDNIRAKQEENNASTRNT